MVVFTYVLVVALMALSPHTWLWGGDLEEHYNDGADGISHCIQLGGAFLAASSVLVAAYLNRNVSWKAVFTYQLASIAIFAGMVVLMRSHHPESSRRHYFNRPTLKFARTVFSGCVVAWALLTLMAGTNTVLFGKESRLTYVDVQPFTSYDVKGNRRQGVQVLVAIQREKLDRAEFPSSLAIKCELRNNIQEKWSLDSRSNAIVIHPNLETVKELLSNEEELKAKISADEFERRARPCFATEKLNSIAFGKYEKSLPPDIPLPNSDNRYPNEFIIYVDGVPPRKDVLLQFRFLPKGEATSEVVERFTDDIGNFYVDILEQ